MKNTTNIVLLKKRLARKEKQLKELEQKQIELQQIFNNDPSTLNKANLALINSSIIAKKSEILLSRLELEKIINLRKELEQNQPE